MTTSINFDPKELEIKVKAMYRSVAENPHGDFHFEMGRALAERLGYLPADLDRIPAEAIDSFAGVGYYFHLADLKEGETVVDLGSGSGMDSFIAALKVGARGKVFGIDMTDEQRAKAERLRVRDGFIDREIPERLHRGGATARRYSGCHHQQRRDQPGNRQDEGISRGRPPVEARRTIGARRYHHGGAAT